MSTETPVSGAPASERPASDTPASETPAAAAAASEAAASGSGAAPAARFGAITFDCADPGEVSRFYREALGLPAAYESDDFVMLAREGAPGLAFHRLPGYQPPTWPDPAREKQAHLELGVDDLDAAQARMIALGAMEPPSQAQPDRWRVLLDPAGHPFCITTML